MPLEFSLRDCTESTDLSLFSFFCCLCLFLSAWVLHVTSKGPPASPHSHLSGPIAQWKEILPVVIASFPEDAEESPTGHGPPGTSPIATETMLNLSWSAGSAGGTTLTAPRPRGAEAGHAGHVHGSVFTPGYTQGKQAVTACSLWAAKIVH